MATPIRTFVVALITLLFCFPAAASHMIGGGITYQYIGSNQYNVTLQTYYDVLNGEPESIAQDLPAYLSIYDLTTSALVMVDTTLMPDVDTTISAESLAPCYGTFTGTLLSRKRIFNRTYTLPATTGGYMIVYARCCRVSTLANISSPGDLGATYFSTIPGSGTAINNSSAVFRYDPPQTACLHQPFHIDHSATDADGDSLTYELCPVFSGADPSDIKPIPVAPFYPGYPYYDTQTYITGQYTAQQPLDSGAHASIDPVSGIFSATPDHIGRYVVGVRCNEWRGPAMINSIYREYALTVGTCFPSPSYQLFAGNDTSVLAGDSIAFHATATFTPASFTWSPGTFLSDSAIANPIGYYPAPGDITYLVSAVSGEGCTAYDTLHVGVFPEPLFYLPTAFTPNYDGINDVFRPVEVAHGGVAKRLKVTNRDGVVMYDGAGAWDGKKNGELQDMGAYSWEFYYNDNKGAAHKMVGVVTLVR